MPTRAQVGRPDGVTNASITPHSRSSTTSPSDVPSAARPSAPRACTRDRGPGSTQAQKSRSPTPAATNRQVSSSSPCGEMKAEEEGAPVVADHHRPHHREVGHVHDEHVDDR